jgi:hypothetical protein
MPYATRRPTRHNNRVPWLEPLEPRDVPSGLGNLVSLGHPLQPLVPVSPVIVLQPLANPAPTIGIQPDQANGQDGTFANLPGKSVPLPAVSLDPVLPVAASVQELPGLGSKLGITALAASVSSAVQPIVDAVEQTLLPVVANLTAVSSTQGVVTRAGSVLSKVLSIPATVEQTLLPIVANVIPVSSTQGVVTRAGSVPSDVQPAPATVEPPLLSVAANATAIVTTVQEQANASAAELSALPAPLSSQPVSVGNPDQQTTAPVGIAAFNAVNPRTTRTAGNAFLSEVPTLPFFQPEGPAFSDPATAASASSAPVDRGTALLAGGEETAETEEPVVNLSAGEGSGLLNALLPVSDNGTDEGWEFSESLNGNALYLWVFGLPSTVVALVAIERLRRRKQEEQPRFDLRPGWGTADVP